MLGFGEDGDDDERAEGRADGEGDSEGQGESDEQEQQSVHTFLTNAPSTRSAATSLSL